MSQSVEVDVVIVGGGLAGLAAARRLDRAGVEWLLVEAADRIGGRVTTDIIDGIPYGTQAELAVASGSPRLFAAASAARRASYALAYSGFIANAVAGGGANLGSAPRPPRYGPHAPLKSGTLEFDCP